MKAQLKAINITTKTFNGKNFDGVEITYQPEPWQGKEKPPVTKFLFSNMPVVQEIKSLSPGDWVDIQFESVHKNGKEYKNPSSFTKIAAPQQAAPAQSSGSGGGGYNPDARQESIEKQCCMKEAVNIIAAMAGNGGYTAANLKKREFLVQEVIVTAKELYAFLSGQEAKDEVDFEAEAAAEFNQESFDEDGE